MARVNTPCHELARDVLELGIDRLIFTGEGCSFTAEVACLPAFKACIPIRSEVIVATDLPLYPGIVGKETCVVALSRTGERRFVLDVLAEAKAAGAMVVAITGNPGGKVGSLARRTIVTCEGAEPAYLKSKSTFAGIAALLALASAFSRARNGRHRVLPWEPLEGLGALVEQGLGLAHDAPRDWLTAAAECTHWAVLGAGAGYGAAADGALKLQEVGLVHASAHSLGFFYHGPLGAVNRDWGGIVLASERTRAWAEILTRELVQAGARSVLLLAPEGLQMDVPPVHRLPLADPASLAGGDSELAELLSPAAHLAALYICIRELSLARGFDPDTPPNMEYMLELILPDGTTEPDLEPSAGS